jgi:hypothetical protein
MLTRVRASLLAWLSVSSLACSKPDPLVPDAATVHAPIEVREQARPSPPTPKKVDELAPKTKAPARGCAVEQESELAAASRGIALQLAGPAVLLAQEDPPALALWQGGTQGWREGLRLALESAAARASAVCTDDACDVAWVDQRMRLLRARVDGGGFGKPVELALGVDRRFAPAITRSGERVLVAYTVGVDEGMHTRVLGARGAELAPIDVTPSGHGAAAPVFVLGAAATLIAIDAHAGVSPLLEIPFDRDGAPQPAIVRTPVSQPYAPPLLAAVQWASGDVEVMFTAIGKLAMTAVGRVPLRSAAAPSALAASRGYGELSFAVARGSRRALFVLETPVDGAKNADRSLTLSLTDGTTTEDGPAFAAPARSPSLMHVDGGYLLAFTRAGTVHAAMLRCAD